MGSPVYGLLGEKLGHSYSPAIYRTLAGLDYRIFQRAPEEVEGLLGETFWAGLNVTIPYKRAVVPYLDRLAPAAERLGNVNTVVREKDGSLTGHNTDYAGFKLLVESLGMPLKGTSALVLGISGGAGTTVKTVLEDLGCRVAGVGRTKGKPGVDLAYDELPGWKGSADVQLLVNATPAGMYPNCPDSPISMEAYPALELFPALGGVVDIVYNPARTGLVMQAERRGLKAASGLAMLVGQAAAAIELYTGEKVGPDEVLAFAERLSATEQNVALIGMPGAGKTRVGQQLAKLTGRTHVDADWEFERQTGMPCAAYIEQRGESAFREAESSVLASVGARSRQVISCGGGAVTCPENYALLHQNSTIVMLDRPLEELSSKGRPISQRDGVKALAEQRLPLYRAWADLVVASRSSAAETAAAVAELLPEPVDAL